MKCFVASAFGREDVDAVYDGCVYPTLKKLSIKPMRVDRVEHNDDIDKKIIDLLEDANLVIADLTYARPSVYFEAGYAAGRGKPVIYIARGDHFNTRDNDPEGLLSVHFDLKMKNIISWSKANDAFSNRLEKRLKHVLRPLIKQQRINDKLKLERENFRSQSENTKLGIIRSEVGAILKTKSFRMLNFEPGRGVQTGALLAIREYNQNSQQIAVICTLSAIKSLFEGIERIGSFGGIGSEHKLPVKFHYIVASLRSVPKSRVTQALPSYRLLEDGTMYNHYERKTSPETDLFVHVLSGIQSQMEFTDAFLNVLARYDLGN